MLGVFVSFDRFLLQWYNKDIGSSKMWKKTKKFFNIVRYFLTDEDNLVLHLLKMKAYECMDDCYKLEVRQTEELEDLVFHINAYLSVPEALVELSYPEFRNVKVKDIIKKYKKKKTSIAEIKRYGDFLVDIETQRAVERDCIFDHAKSLPFGFSLQM